MVIALLWLRFFAGGALTELHLHFWIFWRAEDLTDLPAPGELLK